MHVSRRLSCEHNDVNDVKVVITYSTLYCRKLNEN